MQHPVVMKVLPQKKLSKWFLDEDTGVEGDLILQRHNF